MQLDQFTQLWFNNLVTIISVLAVAVLLFIFILSLIGFKQGKAEETGEKLSDLEETLKRVLENTEVKASAVRAGGASVSGAAASPADLGSEMVSGDLEQLKTELAEKEVEIMKLNDQIEDLQKNSGGPSEELESKLKDLESKLQEYEIIEDDIANLSLYKQENAKLKEELEALRKAGASAAPVAAAVTAEPLAAAAADTTSNNSVDSEDDIMAEFAAAVQEQKASESGQASSEPAPAEDDDIMAEFAAAVEQQKAVESGEAPAATDAEDDIMAEFAAAVQEQKAVESGEAESVVSAATVEPPEEDDIMAEFAAAIAEQQAAGSSASSPVEEPSSAATDEVAGTETIEDASVTSAVALDASGDNEDDEDGGDEDDEEPAEGFAAFGAAVDTDDSDLMGEFVDTASLQKAELSAEPAETAEVSTVEDLAPKMPTVTSNDTEAEIIAEVPEAIGVTENLAVEAKEEVVAADEMSVPETAEDSSDAIDLSAFIDPEDIDGGDEEDEDADNDSDDSDDSDDDDGGDDDGGGESLRAEPDPESEDTSSELSVEQVANDLKQETGELHGSSAAYDPEEIFDQDMIDQFNASIAEQRIKRAEKEKEIAAKVAALGLGKNVKETVTDENMKEFITANGIQDKINDYLEDKIEEYPPQELANASFLKTSTDTDKLLDEVAVLDEVALETTDEAADPGDKLIAEFEAFAGGAKNG